MTLGEILLDIWLVLVGLNWAGWLNVSLKFLAVWAIVTGIIRFLEHVGVIGYTLPVHRRAA